jgi:O-acetyl-ADP-ribose deacetylase (regulator of RNase III)
VLRAVRGNLLDADVEALVNTVNTVGVMGKGIALQFKRKFPENFAAYERACKAGALHPGEVLTFATGMFHNPRFVINFPTKRHWKGRSRLEDIRSGLVALIHEIKTLDIRSIALPPLGCGNGGLRWSVVYPLIQHAFAEVPDVETLVFEPAGAPAAADMATRAKRPKMTPGRAVVLGLMHRYLDTGYLYELTLLEIQKLAYFMQSAGQDLRLTFIRAPYGPYADNLRQVLNHIEGHFIVGFGDGVNHPRTHIRPLPEALREAEELLTKQGETHQRFERLARLIEGFETPYGMELISSVHWVATREDERARTDVEAAINGVHAWSLRKRELLTPDHIRKAWDQLRQRNWL